jgi:hypothetical protein
MAFSLHPEDALRFLILKTNENPQSFTPAGHPPSFDVWMPNVVSAFLISEGIGPRGDPEFSHRPEYSSVWRSFYDAAWDRCHRGIFRLSEVQPEGRGTSRGPLGDGYSLTSYGAEWLRGTPTRYFPTERGRYVGVLEKPSRVLGDGFLQRAVEAAGCYGSGNYLACRAMSGAAAESVLLALAIAKTNDPDLILGTYAAGAVDGRLRSNMLAQLLTPALDARTEAGTKEEVPSLRSWARAISRHETAREEAKKEVTGNPRRLTIGVMDETTRRRVSIANELMTWAYATPRLMRRIDSVVCLQEIGPSQAHEAESIGKRIALLFTAIHEAIKADDTSYGRLTASMDRLLEELSAADATLDRLLRPN